MHGFVEPKVMDVKLGLRTFAESEIGNPKLRADLYEKLVKKYPSHVTEADRSAGAITKHRWLTIRDKNSTSHDVGYRIDGVAGYVCDRLVEIRDQDSAREAFLTFVATAAGSLKADLEIAEGLLDELRRLRRAMEESHFVARHEAIGSSLLLVADAAGRTRVAWIDFAKTVPLADGVNITHRAPWEQGNHEDGVLLGVDNMILAFTRVVQTLRSRHTSPGPDAGRCKRA